MNRADASRRLVLLGCGYLGTRVAELAQGASRWKEVVAVTATVRRHDRLHRAGACCTTLDLRAADDGALAALFVDADSAIVDVVCLLPPSALGPEPAAGLSVLAQALVDDEQP